MNFKALFKIFFIIFIMSQLSSGFLIKRSAQEKNICYVCGWEIDKKNGIIEYVENNCKCKADEQCLRSAKEYRLPGWKFHCKRIEDLKDNLDIVTFPTKAKQQQDNYQTASPED